MNRSISVTTIVNAVFNVTAALNVNIIRLGCNLDILFSVPSSVTTGTTLVTLSIVVTAVSIASNISGNVHILSRLGITLTLKLVLFILFVNSASFLLGTLILGINSCIGHFVNVALGDFTFSHPIR